MSLFSCKRRRAVEPEHTDNQLSLSARISDDIHCLQTIPTDVAYAGFVTAFLQSSAFALPSAAVKSVVEYVFGKTPRLVLTAKITRHPRLRQSAMIRTGSKTFLVAAASDDEPVDSVTAFEINEAATEQSSKFLWRKFAPSHDVDQMLLGVTPSNEVLVRENDTTVMALHLDADGAIAATELYDVGRNMHQVQYSRRLHALVFLKRTISDVICVFDLSTQSTIEVDCRLAMSTPMQFLAAPYVDKLDVIEEFETVYMVYTKPSFDRLRLFRRAIERDAVTGVISVGDVCSADSDDFNNIGSRRFPNHAIARLRASPLASFPAYTDVCVVMHNSRVRLWSVALREPYFEIALPFVRMDFPHSVAMSCVDNTRGQYWLLSRGHTVSLFRLEWFE